MPCGSRRADIIGSCALPVLADLEGTETVTRLHVAEALSYRSLTDEARRAA